MQQKHLRILDEIGENTMNLAITKIIVRRGRHAMRDLDNNSKNAASVTEELLMRLLDENKETEYGKKYGFADIRNVAEYKEKVPLSHYDTYAPYIERMVDHNESNLITAAPVKHYALSSGSVGVPKYIPVTQEELDIYSKYGTYMAFGVVDEYYRNTTGKPLAPGMGLNAIELKMMETKYGIPQGSISSTLLKPIQKFIPYFFTSPWSLICADGDADMKYLKLRFALPRRDISFMDAAFMTALVDLMDYLKNNWKLLCRDIARGIISPDIKVPEELRQELEKDLVPMKGCAKQLWREFEKGFDTPIIPRIWPNMRWVGSIGTGGFSAYTKKMRKYAGKIIPFHYMNYAASEALMGAARHVGDTSYVLVPDGGFYEFIPVGEEDSEETLTIDELEVGKQYEIVITNVSGFYRYRIGDVVRVTGFYHEAPLVEFVYRKSQMLSIAGEKTNEEAVRWVIEEFTRAAGVHVADYSVYANVDTEPGHYVLLMEPDGMIAREKVAEYRDILEAKMMHANPSYGEKIRSGVLGRMELFIVQQQTYQLYRDLMIMKGTSPNQLKPVRVIDTPVKERFFFALQEDFKEDYSETGGA